LIVRKHRLQLSSGDFPSKNKQCNNQVYPSDSTGLVRSLIDLLPARCFQTYGPFGRRTVFWATNPQYNSHCMVHSIQRQWECSNLPMCQKCAGPMYSAINQKYLHFHAQHVCSGWLKVLTIYMKDQLADQFTKGLGLMLFQDLTM
jgi:hypothetical protein